jgi:hypothetical protein
MSALAQGIVHATVLAPELAALCAAYQQQLGLQLQAQGTLEEADAALLGLPALAGAPLAWLANSAGVPVLRVIEDPAAQRVEPMFRHGWLSLEILVGDIDTLAAGLQPRSGCSAHRPTWN